MTWTTPLQRAAMLYVFLALAPLGGCTSERLAFELGRPEPITDGRNHGDSEEEFNMAGRWTLDAGGRGRCALTFESIAGAMKGSVVPDNRCPGQFFASHQWSIEQTALVIRDRNGEPLAQLAMKGDGFDGKSMAGEDVTLTR